MDSSSPTDSPDSPKTLIACVGNMLMLDEGFGPYFARVLLEPDVAAEFFDEDHVAILADTFCADSTLEDPAGKIPVVDAGTMGMSMIPYIRDYDRIIFIDVIDCGEESGVAPGSVLVLTPEEMAEHTVMHTLHDMKVSDVLNNARLAGYDADVSCICVQKQDISPVEMTIDLTPPVKAAVPVVAGALMELLGIEDERA
ncbi:MAG: hydrogenase maturation protease [Coriobacteriaceae bacterium]|nr:hydrogenase maturation protease [Coriobacteriaceae bacterium]